MLERHSQEDFQFGHTGIMSGALWNHGVSSQPLTGVPTTDDLRVPLPPNSTAASVETVEPEFLRNISAAAVHLYDYFVSDALVGALKYLYDFEDPVPVGEFLKTHPFLVPILLEAIAKLRDLFGRGRFALRLVYEGDSPSEPELFAVAKTVLAPEQALKALDTFDEQWWLEASEPAAGKLNFSVEYV